MANDIDTLVDMGFPRGKVEKAWKATNGAGLQPAMDWLLAHPDVSDGPEEQEEKPAGQTLGSPNTTTEQEEGEIQNGQQTAQSLICNDCSKLFRDAASAERHAIRTSHQNFSESTQAIAPLTEEEKKAKLAELKARLAEKRALKARQEEEERRQQEKIRRKAGQEILVAREKLEEMEMKKALEAKKREKEEERLAKARIKAQIEADKRERMAKREAAKQQAAAAAQASPPPPPAAASAATKNYNEARLQIRVPGGQPITHTFSADAKLADVIEYLQSQGCNGPFTLSTPFPRKTFGDADREKTLKDLNLVPSSALVLAYI